MDPEEDADATIVIVDVLRASDDAARLVVGVVDGAHWVLPSAISKIFAIAKKLSNEKDFTDNSRKASKRELDILCGKVPYKGDSLLPSPLGLPERTPREGGVVACPVHVEGARVESGTGGGRAHGAVRPLVLFCGARLRSASLKYEC